MPDDVPIVAFQWVPGLGAGGSVAAQVSNGIAEIIIQKVFSTPGEYIFSASISDGQTPLASQSQPLIISGATLDIVPRGLLNALPNTEYTFVMSARDISASSVRFSWSFGDGPSSTGSSISETLNNQASSAVKYAYSAAGAYGLVAAVRDSLTNEVLAQKSVTIVVGESHQRNHTLNICNTWSASKAGQQGVMIDLWDVTDIPPNAVFDLTYEAYYVPDRFMIEYPLANLVHDTGWVGDTWYHNDPMFPEGIKGPGKGTVQNV